MQRNTPNGRFYDLKKGHFDGGKRVGGEDDDGLRKVLVNQRARQRGVIAAARMAASVNPTAADIACTIGGVQFKVVAALGAADTTVQVLREASAALTYANLVDAINGKASNKGTKWLEATTAFAVPVLADMVTGTVLRIRNATARGGKVAATVPASTALLAAVTGGASAWSVANLNAAGGKALADQDLALIILTITAAMMTNTSFQVELDFTPTFILPQTLVSGVVTVRTDAITISGNAINVALPGGGGSHFAAGDVLYILAAK